MLRIPNRQARALWLYTNGIAQPQTGPADALQIIRDLGFVQIDTIRNVTRAHHHILWSRNPNYREKQLWPLLGQDRSIFEHFTHDDAIRDRTHLLKLFGFEYVNEMFVPQAKRRWGYYVYPLLECDRFVGRIELKADRAKSQMTVTGFWPEPGVKWPAARHKKLDTELTRFARLAGIKHIDWQAQRA